MWKVLKLVRREYRASVKTKGFIIGLCLAPVIMSGSLIAMVLFRGKVDTADKRIAVVDRSGVAAEVVLASAETRNAEVVFDKVRGKKVKPAYHIEIAAPDDTDPAAQRLALSDRVRSRDLHAFVEIGPGVLAPQDDPDAARITYHAENAAIDEVRGWLSGQINGRLRYLRLTSAGVDESEVGEVLTWLPVESMGLASRDEDTGQVKEAQHSSEMEAVLVPIFTLFLMFLMVMMGAMPLLNAVMEEKTQRIAEVILGSVRPFQFMLGKILGGVAVSLTGLSVYAILGVIVASRMGFTDKIPLHTLPWIYAYAVLMIFMLGGVLAALGAVCNDAKDAQNLTFPAIIPIMIPMFLLVPIIEAPTSAFATGLSLFPPFTPMLMLLRMSAHPGIPLWQPWVGLLGVSLFAMLAVWAGGRIFRVAILMQGQPPKLGLLLRWAIRG
ncbi:MAG: ABC transporter permease [Fidelibacterota bacterium]|nr:MAG: ABC transporter permease [Candidatus Neomarinimicrobiota bacterium]